MFGACSPTMISLCPTPFMIKYQEEPPEPLSFTIDLIQLEDLTNPNLQNSPISYSINLTPLADFVDPTPTHDAQPQSLFLELHPLDKCLTATSEATLQSSTTELHD